MAEPNGWFLFLTEELVKQGHKVTLFASGELLTNATLVSVVPESLRLKDNCEDMLAPHIVQLQQVIRKSREFDIIHFHTDYLSFLFASNLKAPHLTTLHGKLTIPELQVVFVVTQEAGSGFESHKIDKAYLQTHVTDFSKPFYLCGPDKMVVDLSNALQELGAKPDAVVFEK